MTIKAILARKGTDVVTAAPTAWLAEAVKVLAARRIGAVVVTGADRRIVGILSERDIVRVLGERGAKVLDAIETALDLQKGTLRDEREVLRGHGNMSAPSVLFVLERALKRGLRGTAVLSALGPGFTASFLALEVSA